MYLEWLIWQQKTPLTRYNYNENIFFNRKYMSTKTLDEREKIIERVEELFLMGHRTAWQVYNHTERSLVSNYDTAKRYLTIVHRRLRNRWKNTDMEKILRNDLQELEMLERFCWQMFAESENYAPKIAAMQNLLKIKAHKARLLGLDDGRFTVKLEAQPFKSNPNIWGNIKETTKRLMIEDGYKPPNPDIWGSMSEKMKSALKEMEEKEKLLSGQT